MKKYLKEAFFEALLLIGILKFQSLTTSSTVTITILKIALVTLLIYTIHHTIADLLSLRILYANIILHGVFLIIFNNAGREFSSAEYLTLIWRGYMTTKWFMIIIAAIDCAYIHKNKTLEDELFKGTRYLLAKNPFLNSNAGKK